MVEQQLWKHGEAYLVFDDCSTADIVRHLERNLDIRTECQVTRIRYDSDGVRIQCQNGRELHVDRVIVTVPVTVLQRKDIDFLPPLSAEKQLAIDTVRMENALKIFLKLSKQFWPADFCTWIPSAFVPTPCSSVR